MAHDPSPCNLARLREAHSATLTLAAGQAVGHKGTCPATEPCTLCLRLGPTLPVLKCHRGSTVSPLPILCPSRSGAQEESPTKPSQGSAQTQGTEPQNLRAPGLWLKGWGAGQSLGAGTCASVRVFACARVCLCVCAHAQGECARCSALKHLPGHNSPPRLPHPPAPAPPVLSSEGWSACCPGRFLLSQSGYPLAAAWPQPEGGILPPSQRLRRTWAAPRPRTRERPLPGIPDSLPGGGFQAPCGALGWTLARALGEGAGSGQTPRPRMWSRGPGVPSEEGGPRNPRAPWDAGRLRDWALPSSVHSRWVWARGGGGGWERGRMGARPAVSCVSRQ